MNERILTLAASHFPRDSEGNISVTPEMIMEFAELIVRECIQEMETSKRCDPYTGELFVSEYNRTIDEQISVLKEHFGVEE
jgi:hypothetical protein